MKKLNTTLCLLKKDDSILLALKKRGFGAGKYNGVGGKIKPGETPEEAMIREAEEEIYVTPTKYDKVGVVEFDEYYNGEKQNLVFHLYIASEWNGEPSESDEMKPYWFKTDNIPYDQMFTSDSYWLPLVLEGKKIKAHFSFDENGKLASKEISDYQKDAIPKRITIEFDEAYLRQESSMVSFDNKGYIQYINQLKNYCQNNQVYALAPVQIGIPKRIIYIRNTTSDMTKNSDDSYNEEIIYINPVIKNMYGHTTFLEGCASCQYQNGDYITGVVDRPYKIDIEYYDINGKKHNKTIEGFESTVFCHEYDHLNGILHMDRIKDYSLMTLEAMREYRANNPYNIIDQYDIFTYDDINVLNKKVGE